MIDTHKLIKNRRKELRYTQQELATLTGYSDRSTIAKIEKGLIDLPESKIKIFAKALKVSPLYLMGYTDDRHYTINGDNSVNVADNNGNITYNNTTVEDSNPSLGNIDDTIALQETNEEVQADMLTLLQEILKVNQENLRVQKEILEAIKKAH